MMLSQIISVSSDYCSKIVILSKKVILSDGIRGEKNTSLHSCSHQLAYFFSASLLASHCNDNPSALPVQYNTTHCSLHRVLLQLYQYLGPHLSLHTHMKVSRSECELLPPLPLLLITTVCFVQSLAAILIGFA